MQTAINLSRFKNALVGDELRLVRLLTDGVAYLNRNQTTGRPEYWVFSHEGDHLGDVPKVAMDTMFWRIRQAGILIGRTAARGSGEESGFTLAWQGDLDWGPIEDWIIAGGPDEGKRLGDFWKERARMSA